MSELVHHETNTLIVPGTGALIDLEDAPQVAQALRDVRDYEQQLRYAKTALTEALVAESSRQGTKTLRLGTLTASVSADTELAWDVTELVKLLDAGLPAERYADLVSETVTYKVNSSVAKQIEAANPAYAAIIERARSRVPKTPYVRVEG